MIKILFTLLVASGLIENSFSDFLPNKKELFHLLPKYHKYKDTILDRENALQDLYSHIISNSNNDLDNQLLIDLDNQLFFPKESFIFWTPKTMEDDSTTTNRPVTETKMTWNQWLSSFTNSSSWDTIYNKWTKTDEAKNTLSKLYKKYGDTFLSSSNYNDIYNDWVTAEKSSLKKTKNFLTWKAAKFPNWRDKTGTGNYRDSSAYKQDYNNFVKSSPGATKTDFNTHLQSMENSKFLSDYRKRKVIEYLKNISKIKTDRKSKTNRAALVTNTWTGFLGNEIDTNRFETHTSPTMIINYVNTHKTEPDITFNYEILMRPNAAVSDMYEYFIKNIFLLDKGEDTSDKTACQYEAHSRWRHDLAVPFFNTTPKDPSTPDPTPAEMNAKSNTTTYIGYSFPQFTLPNAKGVYIGQFNVSSKEIANKPSHYLEIFLNEKYKNSCKQDEALWHKDLRKAYEASSAFETDDSYFSTKKTTDDIIKNLFTKHVLENEDYSSDVPDISNYIKNDIYSEKIAKPLDTSEFDNWVNNSKDNKQVLEIIQMLKKKEKTLNKGDKTLIDDLNKLYKKYKSS